MIGPLYIGPYIMVKWDCLYSIFSELRENKITETKRVWSGDVGEEQDVSPPLLPFLDLLLSHFLPRFFLLHLIPILIIRIATAWSFFVNLITCLLFNDLYLDLFVFRVLSSSIGFAKKTGDVSELQIGVRVKWAICFLYC